MGPPASAMAMGNILTTVNTKMATTAMVIPEVRLFNLTGHNSPTNNIGITLNPIEWNRIKELEDEVKDRDANNKLAKEIIYHLTTKVAELKIENERLRDQHATAPPLKRVCSITQRIYRK